MSFIPFQVSAANDFDAQPSAAGEKLVAVSSSNAANDRAGVVLVGNIAGPSSTSETRTLATDSMIERETSATLISLSSMTAVTTPLTGVISVYGQGVAAEGDVQVTAVPAEGTTLEIGIAGYTQTYTLRHPCRETILCPAGSTLVTGASPGSYIKITLNGVAKYFWFSNGTSTDPAPGGTGYAVVFTGGDSNTTIATALQASMVTNLTNFATSLDTATITITGIALGVITISQDAGNDFTLTAIQAGLADAANQIRTGYDVDGSVASESDVALWIQYAMNASGGTAGTQYGTGTSAHAYLSALASGAVTTVTDRIACRRQLGWSSVAGTGLTVRDPVGGSYGTLIGVISGSTGVTTGQIFNTPDVTDPTLLPLFASSTDAIQVQGRQASLRLYAANVTSAVVVKLQASDDGTTYYDVSGEADLSGTVSGTAAAYVVTGVGTAFTLELLVGDKIIIDGYVYVVASITSATSLITTTPLATSPSGATAKKQRWMQIGNVFDNFPQLIPIPQCEYCRLMVVTNTNTAQVNLHAGLIL